MARYPLLPHGALLVPADERARSRPMQATAPEVVGRRLPTSSVYLTVRIDTSKV